MSSLCSVQLLNYKCITNMITLRVTLQGRLLLYKMRKREDHPVWDPPGHQKQVFVCEKCQIHLRKRTLFFSFERRV